jgi:hypothetical protein
LLLFSLAAVAAARMVVFLADVLPFRAIFFASRSTPRTTLLCLNAFCAASAFATIVPSAAPIDSATVVKSAPSLVRLRLRAFISSLSYVSLISLFNSVCSKAHAFFAWL